MKLNQAVTAPVMQATSVRSQMSGRFSRRKGHLKLLVSFVKETTPIVVVLAIFVSNLRLAEIARRLLCVPASSTASERLFSTAVSKIRNSLKPENVDALLFLNKNCSLLRL